jgi:hypothetical protein
MNLRIFLDIFVESPLAAIGPSKRPLFIEKTKAERKVSLHQLSK